MELLWFYVAIVLAISDTIHTQIVWKIFNKFYLILGGIINNSVNAPWKTWIIHELMEAGFHFYFCVNSIFKLRNRNISSIYSFCDRCKPHITY